MNGEIFSRAYSNNRQSLSRTRENKKNRGKGLKNQRTLSNLVSFLRGLERSNLNLNRTGQRAIMDIEMRCPKITILMSHKLKKALVWMMTKMIAEDEQQKLSAVT